ncbi:hypothetical protein F4809DRAFT_534642 [Biscogniauxia mediterranea]|nr:hypothetical protein F4809DRAFT_534642 [Biscogniauxia mediterranea]
MSLKHGISKHFPSITPDPPNLSSTPIPRSPYLTLPGSYVKYPSDSCCRRPNLFLAIFTVYLICSPVSCPPPPLLFPSFSFSLALTYAFSSTPVNSIGAYSGYLGLLSSSYHLYLPPWPFIYAEETIFTLVPVGLYRSVKTINWVPFCTEPSLSAFSLPRRLPIPTDINANEQF